MDSCKALYSNFKHILFNIIKSANVCKIRSSTSISVYQPNSKPNVVFGTAVHNFTNEEVCVSLGGCIL